MSGDMGEIFNALREHRRTCHRKQNVENMLIINQSGFAYAARNGGEVLLFREAGFPKCDFYPSTGRWRVAGDKRTYRGGAVAFIHFYKRNKQ